MATRAGGYGADKVIFERNEAERTRVFGELMEHEKRIARECGSANSESIGDGGSRKGSVGEPGNE